MSRKKSPGSLRFRGFSQRTRGPPKGSVAGILDTLKAGGSAKVFEDRTVSPSFIVDVARARERLLQFTTEIGNVAFELQGGIGHERQSGQRFA